MTPGVLAEVKAAPPEDKGQVEGAAREVWASHQVTAATLALEVALGVLLMAHVGKQTEC